MSGASVANLDKARTQAKQPTTRWRGAGARGWSPPARSPRLQIGRADDACEAEADAAAERVLADTNGTPPTLGTHAPTVGIVRPRTGPGRAGAAAPPSLERRVAAAADEGRPLPREQRGFFEERFAHDFADVRVHDGPASARAATSAGAQAFTLGRDIYFGAGQYRPQETQGRNLLAHELAHTVQQRPAVIARRALPSGPATLDTDGPTSGPAEEAADDLSQALQGGPDVARDRAGNLDPAIRAEALGRLRARLPAGEGERATQLAHDVEKASTPAVPVKQETPSGAAARSEGQRQPTPGERERGVEAHATPTAPASVQAKDAPVPHGEAPVHEQATMTATSMMQEAVRSVGNEPGLGGAAAPAGVATDSPGSSASAEGSAQEGVAAAAAQKAVGALGAQLAELEEARSVPVRFQQDQGPPGDPEAAARAIDSASLASSFVSRAATRVRTLIDAALKVPGQALTSLGAGQQAVAGQIAAQSAAIHDGADQARKRVRGSAGHVRGSIDAKHSSTDSATEKDTSSAQDRAQKARDKASGGLDKRAEKEKSRITQSYRNAVRPMIAVGADAGGKAKAAAARRQAELLAQRDGESSILDGPIHDDRLEANAEASGKVAEEYDKSFRDSARQQSGKLADSKPEILGKVDEITREAGKGYTSQFEQIQQGASAFEKGAKAQSKQSATQIKGGLEKSAAQSLAGLDAAEKQQTSDLVAQGTAAQDALDQSVAAGLSGLANGVAEASGQLTGSIRDFTSSVAEMPAPQRDELSTALDDASSNVDAPLAAMAEQIASVAPTLATTTDTTRDQSEKSLTAAAGAARQGFDSAATGFAGTAGGMNQQAARGFKKLGAANKTSADDIGKQAEDGFVDAEKNASDAYGKFGDQVEDNFRVGREQMLGSLWGKESQDKLAADMKTYGEQAADQVQPRWKRVLKWVVTIVVIVAVIAITVLSAGSLGPVGVVLLGAALGAAAGAVQTIANNLIDGKKWSDGVVKAMIVGAIGGAVGGAGGVLFKGVGTLALKIGGEAVLNFAGGVAGEVIGSVATGETINWTSALTSALVGAGIGVGLGLAGALKGKIKIGGFGKSGAPPAVRPTVEPPPPAPAGKLRGFLEQTKILAPRPGAAPKVSVGAGVGEPPAPGRTPTPEPTTPKGPTEIHVDEPPAPAPASAEGPVRPADAGGPQPPRGMVIEPSAPRTTGGSAAEPIPEPVSTSRSSSPDIPASSEPVGGPPKAGGPGTVEPTPKAVEPSVTPEPAEPAAPAEKPAPAKKDVAGGDTAEQASPKTREGSKRLTKKQRDLLERLAKQEDLSNADIEALAEHLGQSPDQVRARFAAAARESTVSETTAMSKNRGRDPVLDKIPDKPFKQTPDEFRRVKQLTGEGTMPKRVERSIRQQSKENFVGENRQAAEDISKHTSLTLESRENVAAHGQEYVEPFEGGKAPEYHETSGTEFVEPGDVQQSGMPTGFEESHHVPVKQEPAFAHKGSSVAESHAQHIGETHAANPAAELETFTPRGEPSPGFQTGFSEQPGVIAENKAALAKTGKRITALDEEIRVESNRAAKLEAKGKTDQAQSARERVQQLEADQRNLRIKEQKLREAIPKIEETVASGSSEVRKDLGRPSRKAPAAETPQATPGEKSAASQAKQSPSSEGPPSEKARVRRRRSDE